MKISVPVCGTCGSEEVKEVPSRAILETELEQLEFQEKSLLRLLEKCRKKQEERRLILDALL